MAVMNGRDKGSSNPLSFSSKKRKKETWGITSPTSHDTSITDPTLPPEWLLVTPEKETFENSAEIEVIKRCW